MEFLRELHLSTFKQEQELQQDFDNLRHQYYNILDQFESILSEATDLDFSGHNATLSDLEDNIEKLANMLAACGRGIKAAEKLTGTARTQHLEAIKQNMRRIQARYRILTAEFDNYTNDGDAPKGSQSPQGWQGDSRDFSGRFVSNQKRIPREQRAPGFRVG